MNTSTKLYLADFVAAFPQAYGNHGNTLWQAVMASLRPANQASELEFTTRVKNLLERIANVGASARECRQIKRVLYASYWPGPPGVPELIDAVGKNYQVGMWISQDGLKSYVAILQSKPVILERIPGLSRSGLKVLEQLSQMAPNEQL